MRKLKRIFFLENPKTLRKPVATDHSSCVRSAQNLPNFLFFLEIQLFVVLSVCHVGFVVTVHPATILRSLTTSKKVAKSVTFVFDENTVFPLGNKSAPVSFVFEEVLTGWTDYPEPPVTKPKCI